MKKKTEAPTPPEKKKPAKKRDQWLEHLVSAYGDLLFDLCQTLLWSSDDAPYSYRKILGRLYRSRESERYQRFERAWVFQVALEELRAAHDRVPRLLTPAEQVMLDSNPDPKARLRHFDSYFHRLDFVSQSLLILRDKYEIPMPEVSAILGAPADSLSLKRTQALRQLESWVWSESDAVL